MRTQPPQFLVSPASRACCLPASSPRYPRFPPPPLPPPLCPSLPSLPPPLPPPPRPRISLPPFRRSQAAALIVHQLDTHSALSTLRACREPVDSFVKCLAAGAFATLSDASGPLGEALAAAASAYEAAHPEVRRGRARQAAASFGESLAAAIVRSAGAGRGGGLAVLEGRSSRAATAGAAAEGQATHRISLPPCVLANREPFRSGEWRKEPYPRRRYEPVEVSDVAEPLVRHEVDVRTRVVVEDRASDIPDFGTPGAVVHAGAAGQGFADARAALEDLRSSVASVLRLQGATADQARGLLQAVSERRPLRLGDDVLEVDSWGIDCYTRRNIQDAALQSGAFGKWRAPDYRRILASLRAAQPAKKKGRAPSRAPSRTGGSDDGDDGDDDEALGSARGGSPGTAVAAAAASDGAVEVARAQVEVEARAARWIERSVMPALNAQGANGWDLGAALAALQADPGAWGEAGRRAAAAVAARLERIGTNYFQVHPKGVGVVVSPRGRAVPPFTFVEEYLGEVHPAWRWYELQDAVKRASGAELPDFYNIALERPKHDPSGYDVLFVDASRRGTLASRVSHSCGPNCAAVPLRSRGRLRIALYTLREVAPGEELTFDYACVSESEREFREAICLCGSVGCRGSYLYYTGSRSFSAVLAARHCSLDRTALVLRAGLEPLSDADRARLRAEGVGDACLCDPRHDGRRVPAWLEKWAALALEFGELEERLLRDVLAADARGLYTPEAAAAEAAGVRANRLQSLAITLDKVKLYLAAPGQPLGAPLTPLTEAETLEHLWHGERGIARRALLGILDQVAPGAARRLRRAGGVLLCPEDLSGEVPVPFQAAVAVLAGPASTAAEARERLALAVEAVRAADLEAGGGLTALADLLVLYAATKTWFSHDRSYKGFSSPPLPRSLVREHLPAHSGTARPSSAEALKPAALSKTYRPGYVWGQLSMWHKQTVADPTASLSADRRGALSLPDVESAFCGAQYTGYERSELLGQLERRPDAIWKVWMCWSFRNDAKIYGSPMFDDALARSRAGWARLAPDGQPAMAEPGEGAGSLAEALAHLKCAELPPRMRDTKRAPKAAKRKAPKSRQS